MLLAPMLSLSPGPATGTRNPRRPRVDREALTRQRLALMLAWAFVGGLALLCLPPLRGGSVGGWTLPFWLVAAPLINIAAILWLQRRRRTSR